MFELQEFQTFWEILFRMPTGQYKKTAANPVNMAVDQSVFH